MTIYTYQRDGIGKKGHWCCYWCEEGSLASHNDGVRKPLVDRIQILQLCTLLERIQEHKHVVHANTDDDKHGDNVQNPECPDPENHPVDEERQREAGDDGHDTSDGREDGETAQDKHQEEDESTTRDGKMDVMFNCSWGLSVKYDWSTIAVHHIHVPTVGETRHSISDVQEHQIVRAYVHSYVLYQELIRMGS